jgi:hypothetical protein
VKRFFAILLLFVGFALLLFGGLLMLIGLVIYPHVQIPGSCWPIVAVGLGLATGGWVIRRFGLSQWRAAATARDTEAEK